MANLMHFNPFRDLARLDPLRDFEDMFRLSNYSRDEMQPIRIDVHENDQAYTVRADIPGAKKEDIKVDVAGNRISISAETKRVEEEKQGGNVVRCERYVGQQYRSVTLDHEVDEDKAIARFENGVLELTLPKRAQNGGRKLTIN
ncbi:Hsp20/alpha crystallin family protein [Pseudoduganella sp. UC29_106]|uniref:Hsp20/alpha crystallin family protein n=1 Tax=Pseudoduganella sp. UC29_106 TaxID=3374553 RepID=UPI00375741B9